MMRQLGISNYTVTTALGRGVQTHREALSQNRGGLRRFDLDGVEIDTWIGRVDGLEGVIVEGALADYDCRNNRLAQIGLEQDGFMEIVARAKARYGADRIGVFVGTSTSGIQQTEQAYILWDPESGALPVDFKYRTTQSTFSVGDFTRRLLGLSGVAQVISTACSSSAKVFASAYRYMCAGLCDAAIVGGVDSLCQLTLYGFHSLQLLSANPCLPSDKDRDGINIGEAAGFALLEWVGEEPTVKLLGYGESSDAYHMSSPHPNGDGASLAMRRALSAAGMVAADIDYINLHGTATPANDLSEDRAVMAVFEGETPCSSTKGFTGHTLGAAGIVEAVFACIAVESGVIMASLNTRDVDSKIRSPIVLEPMFQPVERVVSNSFGFGGSNASLIIGRFS